MIESLFNYVFPTLESVYNNLKYVLDYANIKSD